MCQGHAPAVPRGSGGTREGMGTGGIAARPVPPPRDRSPRTGELPPPWTWQRFVLSDAKKGHFQPWIWGSVWWQRLVDGSGAGTGQGCSYSSLKPVFLPFWEKKSFLILCSRWGQRFPSHGGSALARTWDHGLPLPLQPSTGSTSQGWIHPAPQPCPSPCATPAWQPGS